MRTDSPEDRLLRLIKGKYRKNKNTTQARQAAARPPVNTESFLTDVSKKIFMKNKAVRTLFSNTVNNILLVVLIGLGAYLAYNLLFPASRDIERLINEEAAAPREADIDIGRGEAPGTDYVENYSAYSKTIGGKDLFSAPFGEEGASAATVPDIDISKRFNLVGIITGDEPQAIIEDKEAKKTHYLYEGQSINGITVREITEGRVILAYKEKEVMLVL